MFPIAWTVLSSFKSYAENIAMVPVFLPKGDLLGTYKELLVRSVVVSTSEIA